MKKEEQTELKLAEGENEESENVEIIEAPEIGPDQEEKLNLEVWTTQFNSEPNEELVKVNKFANNTKYLPISHIENLLDKYFFGLWSTENFKWENIANELVGTIDLRVRHPLTGEYIVRTGVASVQIRVFSKGEKQGKKVANALVADIPHLKSQCLKNAAKSIGKIFGRDLSRKAEDVDEFDVLLTKQEETEEKDDNLFEVETE